MKRRTVEYDGGSPISGAVAASATRLSWWSCTLQPLCAAYCARSAWRRVSPIDTCWPLSLRIFRRRALTGSCRALRASLNQRSMVERPKALSSPVAGLSHFLAANLSSSPWSSPRGGGAASSCPTTEKRRWAQDWWTDGFRLLVTSRSHHRRSAHRSRPPADYRRASSADWQRPSASVRKAPAAGDRAEEAQQRHETSIIVAGEALEERRRQEPHLDRRHERGRGDMPERALRERLAPPRPPALDGPPAHAQQIAELPHPLRRRAMAHRRDDHYDRAQVDLAPEEAQRWRRAASPAALPRTAKAEPLVAVLPERGRPTARLAWECRRVKGAPAVLATLRPRLGQTLAVDLQLKRVESRIPQQRSVQECLPLGGAHDRHGPDRTE